jgi:hypothetical protein
MSRNTFCNSVCPFIGVDIYAANFRVIHTVNMPAIAPMRYGKADRRDMDPASFIAKIDEPNPSGIAN